MTSTETRPDVAAFVADVRTRLCDLTEEQRDELLDGLEADLSEQLADGVSDVLTDPAAYAVELRAAAGLPAAAPRGHWSARPGSGWLGRDLDRLHAWWAARTASSRWTREAWSLLLSVRPVWWVLRGWIAATLVDQVLGPWEVVTPIPTLGPPPIGGLLLLVAVVASVLVGQGRLWPGSGPDRRTVTRVLLVALNAFAVVVPWTFTLRGYNDVNPYDTYRVGYADARRELAGGLRHDGRPVSNVFAYDLAGNPIDGVQLVDQNGDPLDLTPRQAQQGNGAERIVGCPAFNGLIPLYNVFPLQQRSQRYLGCVTPPDDRTTGEVGQVHAPTPPLAELPPVARAPQG